MILAALTAFGPVTIDLYLPALPEVAGDLGVGVSSAQLTLTACVAGLAVGQLLAGPISDSLGRRRPLIAGLLLFTAASVACALAGSIGVLIAFRVLQGVGGAAGIVIARAIVRDLFEGVAAARVFSLIAAVFGIAPVVAPIVGSQLLAVTDWRGLFAALAGVGVLLLLATVIGTRESLPPPRRRSGSIGATFTTIGLLLGRRSFMTFALTGMFAFTALFAYLSASSFVFQDGFGLSAQQYGLVFAANGVGLPLISIVNARLLTRHDPRVMLAVGVRLLTTGAAIVLAVTLARLGPWALAPALLVCVSAVGLVLPNAIALALAREGDNAGTASALMGVLQFTAAAGIAPLVGIAGSSALPMAIVMAAGSTCALLVSAARAPD